MEIRDERTTRSGKARIRRGRSWGAARHGGGGGGAVAYVLAALLLLCIVETPPVRAQIVKPKLSDPVAIDVGKETSSKPPTDDEQHPHHLWGSASTSPPESSGEDGSGSLHSDGKVIDDQDSQFSPVLNRSSSSSSATTTAAAESSTSSSVREPDQKDERKAKGSSGSNGNGKLSFVGSKSPAFSSSEPPHGPPQGFRLTSRVYTNATDRLAYFDNETSLVLPYWECGMFGSTTGPVSLQHATIRHLLAGSKPHRFSGSDGSHPSPQIVVPLSPLEIVLSSGESQTFASGDVILLENVVHGGHKLQPIGNDRESMTVIMLTLPQSYTHVGKDKISIRNLLQQQIDPKANPCPEFLDEQSDGNNTDSSPSSDSSIISNWRRRRYNFNVIRTVPARKYILAFVGASISALLGDFLGKVAPLWLAVGMGGLCFIGGSTVAFVKAGDFILDELELRQERRRRLQILKKQEQEREVADVGVFGVGKNLEEDEEDEADLVGDDNLDDDSPDSRGGGISGVSPSIPGTATAAAAAKQNEEAIELEDR